jgi:CheY-like chemotaxis protein
VIDTPLVLVVDDDDSTREMLVLALTDEGYRVVEARDGREAIRFVAELHPDLVLLDVRMPGMTGQELLPLLRREHPDLPVVLTSADPRLAYEAAREGATAVLVKPFDLDQLLETVARTLPGPEARRG